MSKDDRAVHAYEELRTMLDLPLLDALRVRDARMQELGLSLPR